MRYSIKKVLEVSQTHIYIYIYIGEREKEKEVNGCPKDIDLWNIFRNLLWWKKEVIDFFEKNLYFS